MPSGVRVRRSIWASLSSAPARLILSPSTSPSQPSCSASAMRAMRLSRISAMRLRWAGSGQCMEQRRQACSWMQGVPNARPQVPVATLRRSKWPRNSSHSASVGVRYSSLGRSAPAAGEEGQVGLDGLVGVDGLVAHGDVDVAVAGDDLGDVRREPVHDRVGDEHPAEVMRGVVQRGAAGGSVRPVRARAAASILRTVRSGMARFSAPMRRWNSSGAGGSQRRSWSS